MNARPLFSSWLRSTMLGWALGVPAIALLSALAESVGQHNLHFPVGAGMGLAVGFFQSRAIRPHLGHTLPWFSSCLLGLASPFLATDLARAAAVSVPYSLYLAVICGGLIVGLWQSTLLHPSPTRVASWTAANVLGWLLASGSVAIADSLIRAKALRGIPGALEYLGLVASGGVLLALVTGLVLSRLLPTRTAA